MRRLVSTFLLLVAPALLCANLAAQVWLQKQPEDWSQRDCERLLRDSPWARQLVAALDLAEVSLFRGSRPRITYVVQLWSARPVRLALARNARFDVRYLAMSPAEREQMDADARGFVEQSYSDAVVIEVIYGADRVATDKDLRFFWGNQSLDSVKPHAALLTPRGRVELKAFTPKVGGRDEMQLTFPRSVAGRPILEPGDDAFSLELDVPRFSNAPAHRLSVRFDARKLLFEGKLEY
jgi:hypothetical protein